MGHAQPADLCAALTSIQDSIALHAEHKILHSPADHAANNKNILLDDYDSLVAWLSENGLHGRMMLPTHYQAGWPDGLPPPEANAHGFC